MKRILLLALLLLLAALNACGGGGTTTPPDNPRAGLAPLDFDITADAGSEPSTELISGWQVDLTHQDWASSTQMVADGKVIAGVLLEPETAPNSGFSADVTVHLRGVSQAGNGSFGKVFLIYNGTAYDQGPVFRSGNSFSFSLNGLGLVLIVEDEPQFGVSAFADLSKTNAGTTINFWAISRNAVEPVSYTWNFGDGLAAVGSKVSHAFAEAGNYTVSLSAQDAAGNIAPVASTPIEIAAVDVVLPLEGVEVFVSPLGELSANFSASVAGGNPPLTYAWDFDGDGAVDSTDGASVEFTFLEAGFYVGTLEVTDDEGQTADTEFVFDARSLQLSAAATGGEAPIEIDFELSGAGLGAFDTLELLLNDEPQPDPQLAPFTHFFQRGGQYALRASATREHGGESYTVLSNVVIVHLTESELVPFLQLTQPINPVPGEPFELYGYDFGDRQGNTIPLIDGAAPVILSWTKTQITLELPAGATGGEVVFQAAADDSNTIQLSLAGEADAATQNVLVSPDDIGTQHALVIGHGFGLSPGSALLDGNQCSVENWGFGAILLTLPAGTAAGSHDLQLDGTFGSLTHTIEVGVPGPPRPQLLTINPTPYEIGTVPGPTLGGTGFGSGAASMVLDSKGDLLPLAAWGSASILLEPPTELQDNFVAVIVQSRASNALPLIAAFRPLISSVSPQPVFSGSNLTVTGVHFGNQGAGDAVLLDDEVLTVVQWTDTEIIVTIPARAVSGELVVRKLFTSPPVDVEVEPQPPGGLDLEQL